ncbi:hypothetical protein KBD34_01460 [Patescibacteria group bacterium]|nr:hypothetical protein [Patescibacteria group bacterium]
MSQAPAASERLSVRIAEISVNQAAFDEKIVGVFRFDLDARGKRGPALILLAEIASSLYVYEQFLDALCAAAERTRQLMSGVDMDPMIRFEKMTQQLNEAVANFIKAEPTPLSWNRINVFALEVSEHGICLTGIGRMTNLFLQKKSDGTHRSFDLFGSLEQPAEINPHKPFASFICGDFHPGDVFFAGTGNFERLRQEIDLKERLITYPPVTAALELKQDLERRHIPDHFSGIIVANVSQPATASQNVTAQEEEMKKPDAAQSVQELHEEQLETETYVETTVSPLGGSGKSLGKAWKERFEKLRGILQEKLRSKPDNVPAVPRATTHDPMTLASLRGMNAGHGGSLSAKTRRKIILGAIGAVLLIGGGFWIQRARQASAEQTLWNAVYTQAVDRRNRADADLLYQNDEKARALVNEAFSLANGLDTKTKEREEAKGKLVQDLEGLRQRLRKEQRVDQPTVVYQTTQGTLGDLLFTDQGLAVIQTDNSSTSLALVTNSVAETVISIPQEATPISSIALTKTGILTLSQQKQLALVSLSRKSAGVVALNSPVAGSSQGMSIYNNRLYVVDGTAKTIWRYTASGNGFGQETGYLKTPVEELTQATSLAIDSNIYVGLSNGRILKFLSGAQQPWDDAQTDPALTEVTKLWATADGERIVALDGKSKRLAIYSKTGVLIGQIVSSAFEQPTGLTVDPKARKIFVSDGQKVLQFDLL